MLHRRKKKKERTPQSITQERWGRWVSKARGSPVKVVALLVDCCTLKKPKKPQPRASMMIGSGDPDRQREPHSETLNSTTRAGSPAHQERTSSFPRCPRAFLICEQLCPNPLAAAATCQPQPKTTPPTSSPSPLHVSTLGPSMTERGSAMVQRGFASGNEQSSGDMSGHKLGHGLGLNDEHESKQVLMQWWEKVAARLSVVIHLDR
jgi:hypothetical protein